VGFVPCQHLLFTGRRNLVQSRIVCTLACRFVTARSGAYSYRRQMSKQQILCRFISEARRFWTGGVYPTPSLYRGEHLGGSPTAFIKVVVGEPIHQMPNLA
jgi:hypothetical protein